MAVLYYRQKHQYPGTAIIQQLSTTSITADFANSTKNYIHETLFR